VVEGFTGGTVRLISSEDGRTPILGKSITVEIGDWDLMWYFHPDPEVDIAIMPVASLLQQLNDNQQGVFFRSVDKRLLPTDEELRDLKAIEDVLFLGYPNGIFDRVSLLPVARRGITATPIRVDYNGQPTFLIDASVFPGSSGSRVFIAAEGGFSNAQGFMIGTRVHFLGVVAAVHYSEERGRIVIESNPVFDFPVPITRQLLNLGIVFKAHTVVEAIEDLLRLRSPNLLEIEETIQEESNSG
jgi:hypothetical protein